MGGKGSGGRRYRAGRKGVTAAANLAAAAAQVAVENVEGAEEAETEDDHGVALLPDISPATAALVDHVWVQRIGPVTEGVLGQLQPDEGIEEIQKRWGGGKYKLVGRTSANKLLVGAYRTVEVSGEPKFRSKAAEAEYRRQVGTDDGAGSNGSAGRAPPATAALDVLAIMAKQEDREESRHRRDLEYLREQAAQREKDRIAADERRERERKADDDRREKERKADEERDRRHTEEARSRDREFFSAMLKMSKDGGSQIDVLKTGIDLALKLRPEGEGGGGDPMSAVLAGIPMLAELFKGAGAVAPAQLAAAAPAVRQLPPQGPQAAPGGAPAPPVAPPPKRRKESGVVLEGPLGDKARAAIRNLTARGVDPEKAFAEVMDRLSALGAQTPAEPVAPPPVEVPAEVPAPNGVQVDAASSGTSAEGSVRPEG